MGDITNTGLISGTSSSVASEGYGIYNNSGTMGNITNGGIIRGTGEGKGAASGTGSSNSEGAGDGTGIYNKRTMGNITNTGIIRGTGEGKGAGSGTGTGEGYGIYNKSTMGNITNTGVIYGTNNAIKNDKSDNITVNNYGILVNGKNQDVNAGSISSNNYGLIIKNEGENQGDITAGNEGTQDIAMEYGENGQVIKSRSMTIKNEIGSNSFDGNKENHILNALKDTYKVTGSNNKVTGSIINAYGTAVVLEIQEIKS